MTSINIKSIYDFNEELFFDYLKDNIKLAFNYYSNYFIHTTTNKIYVIKNDHIIKFKHNTNFINEIIKYGSFDNLIKDNIDLFIPTDDFNRELFYYENNNKYFNTNITRQLLDLNPITSSKFNKINLIISSPGFYKISEVISNNKKLMFWLSKVMNMEKVNMLIVNKYWIYYLLKNILKDLTDERYKEKEILCIIKSCKGNNYLLISNERKEKVEDIGEVDDTFYHYIYQEEVLKQIYHWLKKMG